MTLAEIARGWIAHLHRLRPHPSNSYPAGALPVASGHRARDARVSETGSGSVHGGLGSLSKVPSPDPWCKIDSRSATPPSR